MTLRRLGAALLGIAAVSAAVPVGASAAPRATGVAPAVAPAAAVARSFSCTGIISRDYTRQTVTGTLTGLKPSNVSVFNYVNTVLLTKPTPGLTNGWWGGYWKASYQLNQWNLGGDASGNYFHLMLPDTRMGGTFGALLVTEFGRGGVNGNWQNWMDCTAG